MFPPFFFFLLCLGDNMTTLEVLSARIKFSMRCCWRVEWPRLFHIYGILARSSSCYVTRQHLCSLGGRFGQPLFVCLFIIADYRAVSRCLCCEPDKRPRMPPYVGSCGWACMSISEKEQALAASLTAPPALCHRAACNTIHHLQFLNLCWWV